MLIKYLNRGYRQKTGFRPVDPPRDFGFEGHFAVLQAILCVMPPRPPIE